MAAVLRIAIRNIASEYDIYCKREADMLGSEYGYYLSWKSTLTILGLYYVFVFYWGPQWMKSRPAFNLDKYIQAFNIFQVVSNLIIGVVSVKLMVSEESNINFWKCIDVVGPSHSLYSITLLLTSFYHILKITDLLDTIFFVLRKKTQQVTTLHVYHHIMMVLATKMYMPYVGGQFVIMCTLNVFVHVMMYSYYFWSNYSPGSKHILWWKKRITQVQITQFLIAVVHLTIGALDKPCMCPRFLIFIAEVNCLTLLYMFSQFYYKTYIKTPKKKQKLTDDINNNQNNNEKTTTAEINLSTKLQNFKENGQIESKYRYSEEKSVKDKLHAH